jgi:dimethylaniline monooxygenase (N-oxide forming)
MHAEQFIQNGGSILHSSEVTDVSVLKGKDVITVGFAKSATDLSVLASEHAKSSTLSLPEGAMESAALFW